MGAEARALALHARVDKQVPRRGWRRALQLGRLGESPYWRQERAAQRGPLRIADAVELSGASCLLLGA